MFRVPLQAGDPGAWVSADRLTGSSVAEALHAARAGIGVFEANRARLIAAGADTDGVNHALGAEEVRVELAVVGAVLTSCLFIEGTVNHYGTIRLGETFFRKHLERLRVTSKLVVILAICETRLLDDGSELGRVDALFDRRNQLAHPKTRQVRDGAWLRQLIARDPSPADDVALAEAGVVEFLTFAREADPQFERFVPEARTSSSLLSGGGNRGDVQT